jgi:2-oxoglutarate dehydrogenase E1 component
MANLPDGNVTATSQGDVTKAQKDGFKILALIRAYMTHGHYKADIDPLNLASVYENEVTSKFKKPGHEMLQLLDPAYYGFTEDDLDRKFFVSLPQWGGILGKEKREWTLREIVAAMDAAYCGKIGIEYMHIPNREQCNYIREKIELRHETPMTKE